MELRSCLKMKNECCSSICDRHVFENETPAKHRNTFRRPVNFKSHTLEIGSSSNDVATMFEKMAAEKN